MFDVIGNLATVSKARRYKVTFLANFSLFSASQYHYEIVLSTLLI